MATQTSVTLIDDIKGGEAAETVAFGLDGAHYEIDLNAKNAKALRKAFATYVDFARRQKSGSPAGRRSSGGGGQSVRSQQADRAAYLTDIREWARASGYEVAERGRIAAAVIEAYEAAQ